MATTLNELRANIEAAVTPGFRHKLLARGQSRGMIWRDGVLPLGSPNFSPELSNDLLSYGYSLLLHGLRYAELGGEAELARVAFEHSAEAIEAVIAKGGGDAERAFHRLIAAAAYHLGRYSARAYSLLHMGLSDSNRTTIESGLSKLMLRDLDGLAADIRYWFDAGLGSDETLIAEIAASAVLPFESMGTDDGASEGLPPGLVTALDGNFMSAMAMTMLALERGDASLISAAQERLKHGLDVAGELNLVSQWWCHRIAIQLIGGLWDTSFHRVLPLAGPPGVESGNWLMLRKLFIGLLHRRGKAEVELWPSQLRAAQLVLHFEKNLVLSLPTSAGKTRIAELCILACLSQKKRVVFVTPLRALSAQTEVGLRRTFTPLGKTVSSLYGSIGVSNTDVDALRSRDIVVATPEKLDFALRSDPGLLDDIGLIVLDEGHMIGLGEREIRYEAQIQRLLCRSDASMRRIVCLSAILPDGDQLEDFTAWLTRDKLDGLIKDNWRPTRLRYGEVDWRGDEAQLNVTVGDEKPFIPGFLTGRKPTQGRGRKIFPSNQTELCIATSWRLMDEGQTVLVFCPLRVSVLPFARAIIEMHKRGHIGSVLTEADSMLGTALTVGAEWFGPNHEILACLKLGVAVHHGALPTPYRKEVERLLRDGVLKLTVSSPTLAQGLNLAATSLVFHGHTRNRGNISVAEFRNVVGRAGRAYVDIEGLVLYPMYDKHAMRRKAWRELTLNQEGLEMESGLVRLVYTLLSRMAQKLQVTDTGQLLAYVAGQGGWDFPLLDAEDAEVMNVERGKWRQHLMNLDTAIFSLLGDTQVSDTEIEVALDKVLQSSLFQRRLARWHEVTRVALNAGLTIRAKHIWSQTTPAQRRGYFLAGVGLATGKELDEKAVELEKLLQSADVAIDLGWHEDAIKSITQFAEIAFLIPPFSPDKLIDDWREVLRLWLLGSPLTEVPSGDSDDAISFIEKAFVYNLPWAMEALRVRAEAHEDPLSLEAKLSDYSPGHAVAALETGTLSIPAAILIQAGFASRLGAISAVMDTQATFDSMTGLTAWLASDDVLLLSLNTAWPTPSTHRLWLDFTKVGTGPSVKEWTAKPYTAPIAWHGVPMPPGTPLRLGGGPGKETHVFTADYTEVGRLKWSPPPNLIGMFVATANGTWDQIDMEYIGPNDLLAQ